MSTTEEELFASVRRELFSAVIGDVMDKIINGLTKVAPAA